MRARAKRAKERERGGLNLFARWHISFPSPTSSSPSPLACFITGKNMAAIGERREKRSDVCAAAYEKEKEEKKNNSRSQKGKRRKKKIEQ